MCILSYLRSFSTQYLHLALLILADFLNHPPAAVFYTFAFRCVNTFYKVFGLKHGRLIKQLHCCVVIASEAGPLLLLPTSQTLRFCPITPYYRLTANRSGGGQCRRLIQTCRGTLHHVRVQLNLKL